MNLEARAAKLREHDIHSGPATIVARPGEPMTWAGLGGVIYTNRASAMAAAKRLNHFLTREF